MKKSIRTATAKWIEKKTFNVTTGSGHGLILDSATGAGGNDLGPSPMELVLAGLAGCTGMDVVDILKKKRQRISNLEIQVRGTRSDATPAVYEGIEIIYIVSGTNVSPNAVERAVHLSETKYCSVGAMLAKTARIKTRFEILEK